jgi:Rhabdovirus nucleocapsid protein
VNKCELQVARMRLNFSSWWTNPDCNKLCCAIDMFLFKVKGDYSFLRLGTIHLRERDCGLKVLLDTFMNDNNLKFHKNTQSMYTKKMANELCDSDRTKSRNGAIRFYGVVRQVAIFNISQSKSSFVVAHSWCTNGKQAFSLLCPQGETRRIGSKGPRHLNQYGWLQ